MSEFKTGITGLILDEPLLFEITNPGAVGADLPPIEVEEVNLESVLPADMMRDEINAFPELSEPEVVRHFTRLSTKNFSVDGGFYPLGSCTMKYNPKVNEVAASLDGFLQAHPYQDDEDTQGLLELLFELEHSLMEISGMDAVSLHPAAGSHGEFLGLKLIRAFHDHNQASHRNKILIPDSAHGTNPSSAAVCGYDCVTIPSGVDGTVDINKLRELMDDDVAGIMLTNPNTCGLFEKAILEIVEIVHEQGGLVYMDGANMNALTGIARPGDMGVDVLHFNVHKTFSTPHGGGGPGGGPIGLKKKLEPFLPKPVIRFENEKYKLEYNRPLSIGKIRSFSGNIGVLIRAYTYLKTMGPEGLREMSETAIVNANYLKKKLANHYFLPFPDDPCMHEVLFAEKPLKENGLSTMDVAKGLIENGFHPPTVYFPLIVKGAMLIEPTETESRATLDQFADTLIELSQMNHDQAKVLPTKTVVTRVDEVTAARKPVLKWTP
jgi:glycine dehydrogenase subunit 2